MNTLPVLPLALAIGVFFSDCVVAVIVYNLLLRRGNPMALPIAGFIVLAGLVSAVLIFRFGPGTPGVS